MSRSAICGIDQDIKKVFAVLYDGEVKIMSLQADYSNDQDLEFAKRLVTIYVNYYKSVEVFDAEYMKKEFDAEGNPSHPDLNFFAEINIGEEQP